MKLGARIFRRLNDIVAFACLIAMCKGVKDRMLRIESKPGNLNGSCERDAEAGVLEFH